jgi:Coenzyme PQQ synthesis protein D (PqqD)
MTMPGETPPGRLTLDCVVQRDQDVIAAEADQDVVMVSIAKGLYYAVSDIAREIWETIDRPKKISDLIDDLTATYKVDRHRCEEETLAFLEDLRTEGLLRVRDGTSA